MNIFINIFDIQIYAISCKIWIFDFSARTAYNGFQQTNQAIIRSKIIYG